MDLADFTILFLCLFVVGLFIWLMRTGRLDSKDYKEYAKEQEKRLNDERVYDPNTGRFYTLEELENGVEHLPIDVNALYSDEEIEQVFTDDPSFPLVHNDLINRGFLTAEKISQYQIFLKTATANTFLFCSVQHAYQISDRSVLFIMSCEYKIKNSWSSDLYFIGAIPLKRPCSHVLLERHNWKEGVFRLINRLKSQVIDGWNVLFFEDSQQNEELISQIIRCFSQNKMANPEIIDESDPFFASVEVFQNVLFFKSEKPLNAENLPGVLAAFSDLEVIAS